jgi:hypothetical protein
MASGDKDRLHLLARQANEVVATTYLYDRFCSLVSIEHDADI